MGVCNHQAVCGRCCLRLRLCFSNNRCSLCNTELKEVRGPFIITHYNLQFLSSRLHFIPV